MCVTESVNGHPIISETEREKQTGLYKTKIRFKEEKDTVNSV